MNKLNQIKKKWYQEDLVQRVIIPLTISAAVIFLLAFLKHHGVF